MADYNISEAFAVIEDYLIDSMRRNMLRHIGQEKREGISWSQWQAEMLSGLREYKRENADKFKGIYPVIEQKIEQAMWEAYDTGEAEQEQVILSAIRKGYTAFRPTNALNAEFFRMNRRKMNALVGETQKSMTKATHAALRMANDQYRSIIFGAQVFYNAGAGTLWQAVDMASKRFLQAGLNCIEYRNGNRVNIASYAEMALRTANTRAYLHGEAAKREQYGIHTVIVNRHNAACPLCVPFQGRVFIDDVWGGGTAAEAQVQGYPLLSEAMADGLYHPNCKDGHTTFFVGINRWYPPTERMKEEQVRRYNLQQQQRYHERQIRKYKRLTQGTVDEEQRIQYTRKLHEWQNRTQALIDANPTILRRSSPREQLRNIPEELGITPPRNPPGIEIFVNSTPEKPKADKVRPVIDVKAYSAPPKPSPGLNPSEAERRRDIERIKAKTRLVRQKADELHIDAKIARYNAQVAYTKAQIAARNADKVKQNSAQTVSSLKAKAHLRDKQVTRQMWDAKLSVAEAKRLRQTAEIAKTEARAAQRRYATLMKLDNGGKLKISVETKAAYPTAVKVKPTPKSRPVATVSVTSKPPVTVGIADEQRKRDIEAIRAKVRLVKQKVAEMEKEAQLARQAAQAAETKAQKATQNAESAKQAVHSIKAKTKLRDQQVSKQMLDAKISIAQAKELRQAAEIAKAEARAAQRRYSAIIKQNADSRITASVKITSDIPIPVKIQISPEREEMLQRIAAQPWMQQVKPEQREDFARLFAGMDDKRLRFWEKYGKLIRGDFYCPSDRGSQANDQIYLNLSKADNRSRALGYSCNIRAFLHESGHLMDGYLRISDHLPQLQEILRDEFLLYVDNLLGTNIRFNPALLRDRQNGIFHPVNYYHVFTFEENKKIALELLGNGNVIQLRNGVSDIMSGLTSDTLLLSYNHRDIPGYWMKTDNMVAAEAIAHLFEAYMNGGRKYHEFVKYFPRAMEYFEKFMEKMI